MEFQFTNDFMIYYVPDKIYCYKLKFSRYRVTQEIFFLIKLLTADCAIIFAVSVCERVRGRHAAKTSTYITFQILNE